MKKLRIALITNVHSFAWQKTIIDELISSPFSEIVLNINVKADDNTNRNSNKKIPFLLKIFFKIDSKFFNPTPNALKETITSDLLRDMPLFKITQGCNFGELEDYDLDVIINLTDNSTPTDLADVTKYGVWFLNHCNLETINKRPYGIWEMLNKEPEMTSVLRYINTGMQFPKTIDQTFSCTDRLSYKRNLNDILWQSHSLVKRNLKLLSTYIELFDKKLNSNASIYSDKPITIPFLPPSNIEILGFGTSLYLKKAFQVIKSKFQFDQWALIFFNNKNNENPYDLKKYTKILPPKDRFWADPFLIKHNDITYLFIEELIYKNKLGHLAVMEIDDEGNYTKPQTILVKDYHLSYPFVFQDNGNFYMIPETSGNNDIQLYKATNFPLKWELEKVIMKDVVAVDTTIYKEDDTYWMFTNIKKHKGESKHVELNLFSSNSLFADEWVPHPLNPIVSDIKTARPAGKLFKAKNKLYRPSQNCSNHYGYGLNISEITTLSNNDFKETIIAAIKPDWSKSINCTHSFNSAEQLYISDIKIKRNRFF
ncbi:hypothetical protein DFQ10_102205 [Winogradskyella eximia]|uniref:Glucosamine inositolphosphorylceramide transferase 1 N-terminal domain-containing protein n=1 Tax=Winogradskyella eximia TaxID=262006 RepID=A0A3D9H755_9FLAO|nr:hypothetical protein [Winogradskyella eximia]RED45337.1 hypothetical protein DFQ10_102205 [Winogradskyella eximia]